MTTNATAARPRKEPAARQNKSPALRSLLGFVILLILIGLLLPILRNWGAELKTTAEANAALTPMYATVSID